MDQSRCAELCHSFSRQCQIVSPAIRPIRTGPSLNLMFRIQNGAVYFVPLMRSSFLPILCNSTLVSDILNISGECIKKQRVILYNWYIRWTDVKATNGGSADRFLRTLTKMAAIIPSKGNQNICIIIWGIEGVWKVFGDRKYHQQIRKKIMYQCIN